MLETPGKQRLCLSNLSMNQDHKEFVKAQDSYIEANYTSVKLEGKKKIPGPFPQRFWFHSSKEGSTQNCISNKLPDDAGLHTTDFRAPH